MKTLSIILLALAGAGCARTTSAPEGPQTLDPYVYKDGETGCEYVSTAGSSITPRIDGDGLTHRGCRKTDRVSP